jgi:hypothetical protein
VRDGVGGKLRQIIADPASRTPSGNTKEWPEGPGADEHSATVPAMVL